MTDQQKLPTFKIVTGALKAVEAADGRKTLHCTASSTINDRHGDEITEECIRDMSRQAISKAMTIFLNHQYNVPEDVFGKTFSSQVINRVTNDDGTQVWDMDLDIELAKSNDRSARTWSLLKDDNVQLGVSIGAMIEDWEYIDKDAGFWGGLRIKKVDLLEASIVGIPANQRSWVQNAVKAIKSFNASGNTVAESDEETPMDPKTIVHPDLSASATALVDDATPDLTPESVSAAAEVETPEPVIVPEETPQVLPEVSASADEGGTVIEAPEEAAGEVSDDEIVLALTLQISGLKAQLKVALAQVETLRQKNVEFADYVKDADAVLAAVAKTPVGRKTSMAKTVDTFHSRVTELYGPEIAKYLEITPNG